VADVRAGGSPTVFNGFSEGPDRDIVTRESLRKAIDSTIIGPVKAMSLVEIYTDGGCKPNPGRGGYGVVLIHPKKRAEFNGGFRKTTNNRMEIYAAIVGLEMLKRPCNVTLYSDSQYLVKAMMEGWVAAWKRRDWRRANKERPENVDLWKRLHALCQLHEVEFRWVRGHAGHRENECCDRLSMAALREPNLPVDEGYENKPETEAKHPDMQQDYTVEQAKRVLERGPSLLEQR
jgi:ribonuclease HI